MEKKEFISLLRAAVGDYSRSISDKDGNWVVKGFVDLYKDVYTISTDTKIVSKIIELHVFPKILDFAARHGLEIQLAKEQNHYPDMTFKDNDGHLYAVDLKSSYRKDGGHVNGMTLGSFTGYFRNRSSRKNVTYPYEAYQAHVILGVIYTPVLGIDERKRFPVGRLEDITSVAKDFTFFVQEKWKIASDRPGSGNTKNIGSVSRIGALLDGKGPFASLGEEVFDDYWTHYLTKDMAQAAELQAPYYRNLAEYESFKNLK